MKVKKITDIEVGFTEFFKLLVPCYMEMDAGTIPDGFCCPRCGEIIRVVEGVYNDPKTIG